MNIVLVPGILGFDRLGPVTYFNGVAEHLQRLYPACHVFRATTDPLGTIASRAALLAEQIRRTTALDPTKPLHVLAHSMGGLDVRFLVRYIRDVGQRVVTVVGICTPHYGTRVATVIDAANPLQRIASFGLHNALLDFLRAHANAVHDLSEGVAREFDRACPDDARVRYFDVIATGRREAGPTSLFFAPTFIYLSALGPNDGMVGADSACRGRRPYAVWPGDHADVIGHNLDDPLLGRPVFNHLDYYAELVSDLIVPRATG